MENQDPTISFTPTEPDNPFLLAADVDGTLLGNIEGEIRIKDFVQQHGSHFYLAFVTGRSLSSVTRLVSDERLPQPDFICGVVGTEIVDVNDPHNGIGSKYASQVAAGWDPEAIYALGVGEGIRRQMYKEGQPRFQAGFDWDGHPKTLAAFRTRLSSLTGIRILPCFGQYIDVLPYPVGKGGAVRFLGEELDLDPERIIVAGDSGNDREMFETGFKGILPVNALDELKAIANQPWHYQSLLPAALGILDGLRHFDFIQDT